MAAGFLFIEGKRRLLNKQMAVFRYRQETGILNSISRTSVF